MIIAKVLNGTNYVRDAGVLEMPSGLIDSLGGVRKGYGNECLITTNNVATGIVYVPVTRTSVTPNETFLVPVEITSPTAVDTSGNGFIIVKIDPNKVNDGSGNSIDGSGIATIEKSASMPSTNAVKLATLASGVITDARVYAQLSSLILRQDQFIKSATGSANNFVVNDPNIKTLIHGTVAVFIANFSVTGATTLNYSGTGAKTLKKYYNVDLITNDILINQIVEARYDAVNDTWQMMSNVANIPSVTDAPSLGNNITAGEDGNAGDPLEVNTANVVRKFRPIIKQINNVTIANPIGSISTNNLFCRLSDTTFILLAHNPGYVCTLRVITYNPITKAWAVSGSAVNMGVVVTKILRLSSTKCIMSYKDGSGLDALVVYDTASGLGTAVAVSTGVTSSAQVDMCLLDINKIAVVYRNLVGINYISAIRACTISGSTITAGTEVTLKSNANIGDNVKLSVSQIGTNSCVASFNDGTTNQLACVCSVSGTTVTKYSDTTIYSGAVGITGADSPFESFGTQNRVFLSGAGNRFFVLSVASNVVSVAAVSSLSFSAKLRCVSPFDVVCNSFSVAGGDIRTIKFNGSNAVALFDNPLVISGGGTMQASNSYELLSTGELASTSLTSGDFNFFILIPTGRPYGLAKTAFLSSSIVKVITAGECPLPVAVNVGQEVFVSWGGSVKQSHSESIAIGMPNNTTNINLNITRR